MAIWFAAVICAAGAGPIFLGPPESGTWSGSSKWLSGAYGAATTSYDFDNPDKGACAFVISNTVAGKENRADWRCLPFSLGPAAGGSRPVIFSFAYELADEVEARNNIHVQLRFFDVSGTDFISEYVFPIGAHTHDAAMTQYRTLTVKGIPVPRKARTADIWVDANIFEPWVSGTARFDDFSLTTEPRSLRFKAAVIAGAGIGVCLVSWLSIQLWRRRASASK